MLNTGQASENISAPCTQQERCFIAILIMSDNEVTGAITKNECLCEEHDRDVKGNFFL